MKRGILLLVAGVLLSLVTAWAASGGRDMAREEGYEKELAAIECSLVPTFKAATVAMDSGNYAESSRLYSEVYAKASGFDVVTRRLGTSLVLEGRRAEGLLLCEKAVSLKRSSDNLSSLAYNLVSGKKEERNRADSLRALAALKECRQLPGGNEVDVISITAQVALQMEDMSEFRSACDYLQVHYPENMATHYFNAIQAAIDEHWMKAEDEIKAAEKLGLPHESAQRFLDSGVHANASGWRFAYYAGITVAVWVGGLTLLFSLGYLLSKLTLRQAEAADTRFTINSGEHRLRQIYRIVLNIAGVYYYISLPVVVVLVIGIAGAIVYGFLCLGQIPIKLTFLIVIGGVATIYSLIRSLFVRVKAEDPGRELKREEAEGLWQLTDEVARTVNTRPIDEIRITMGTELAVYERGTWREKLRNQATRILILGVGVLKDFKIDDFRCVLAHEYGHFSHRDTAGGDIAFRVRTDILKFYYAMRDAGQATQFNVAFQFLRAYDFIFRRISHGATRLQEILADRVAAQSYGALALEGGLTHVIRRSIEFHRNADIEVNAGIRAKRALANLYEWRMENDSSLEKDLAKAISRETTEDDTHPSPKDRFRLVASLKNPACSPQPGEVWSLFRNREAITLEMMVKIEHNVASQRERDDTTLQNIKPSKPLPPVTI